MKPLKVLAASAAIVAGSTLIAAQPTQAVPISTAIFECRLSAGKVRVTMDYHVSPGGVLYGDRMKFTAATPGFDINSIELLYLILPPGSSPEVWRRAGLAGDPSVANGIPNGYSETASGPDSALFNVATDRVLSQTQGYMSVAFQDGIGPTKWCSSPAVVVSA